jgi:hypothetical protein
MAGIVVQVGVDLNNSIVYLSLKKEKTSGCLQLTPVILATQEAEISRIAVQSQPRQIVHDTLS